MSSLTTSSRILQNTVRLLDSTISSLDTATRDTPRLKKVLETQKVFGLVPELDLESAKRHVHSETHPQIKHMVDRIGKEVGRLRRKKAALQSKVELQRVRLETAEKNRDSLGRSTANDIKLERLKLLQDKKERLKYTLSRLNLQTTRARLSSIPSLPPQ